MSQVLCPFCLARFDPQSGGRPAAGRGRPAEPPGQESADVSCPTCRELMPQLYLDTGLSCPSDVVLSLGRRGNGKTTLLAALLGTLVVAPDRLHRGLSIGTYTPGLGPRAGGAGGQGPIAWARRAYNGFMEQGVLPQGTILTAEPIPFYFSDLPPVGRKRYRQRNLFLFDVGGEVFDNAAAMASSAQFAAFSRVLWVIVSLDENGQAEQEAQQQYGGIGGSLWDLLNVYAEARARVLRANPARLPGSQALLVVFTKADASNGRLPGIEGLLERESYSSREERAELSRMLRGWLARTDDAGGALSFAAKHFARIEFCAVSATGGAVGASEMRMDRRPRPCRIFDPLLWTWELTDELARNRLFRLGRG